MNQISPNKTTVLRLAIIFWFLRMVLPGMIYLFVPSVMVLLVLTGLNFLNNFKKPLVFEFLKTFNPLLLLGIFFVLGILLSGAVEFKVYRDLGEFAVNLLFLFILFHLLYQKKQKSGFLIFFRKITKTIGYSAFYIALLGIVKYVLQIYQIPLPIDTPYGTAFNDDTNFYALYSFLGIISFYPELNKQQKTPIKLKLQLIVTVLLINVIFSFSTRSILLLIVLSVFMIVNQGRDFFIKKRFALKHFSKNVRLLTIFLTLFLIFTSFYYIQNQQYYFGKLNHQEQEKGESLGQFSEVFHFQKWKYAWEMHSNSKVHQKLFGVGFTYLNEFGLKFHDNENRVDYPHNPILSALLYSGLIGAIFTLIFLAISFYYGVIYFKKYPLFSLMLFVCLSFVFFSGNSLFSVPIFLFLFSLSFLIRHQEISELEINENLRKPGSKVLKETFDYVLASLTLVVFGPVLILLSIMIWISMGWPVIFSQYRIGQNGKVFKLHKFRSMRRVASNTSVAAREQMRITKLGKILRKYKLDELPELWNIIRGDMSFVGPRPDVPGYADKLEGDDRIILELKPGLTGAASLKYIHEEEILSKQEDPQKYNDEVIFPDKVNVNKLYMEKWTLWLDIKLILYTAMGKARDEKDMF